MSDSLGQLLAGALLLGIGALGFALGYRFGRARGPYEPQQPEPRRPRRRSRNGPAEVHDFESRRPRPPEQIH